MRAALEVIESRGLPAAPGSERTILALCLGDTDVFDAVRTAVDSSCFSSQEHRHLWAALCESRDAGSGIDRVALAQWLHERGRLDAVGGAAGLADLDSGVPRGLTLDPHLSLVQDKATLRRTIAALNQAMLRCIEPGNDSAEVLDFARQMLDRISTDTPTDSALRQVGRIIDEVGLQEFCAPTTSNARAIPLPEEWPQLRRIYPCFRAGQLIVLAGFTSQGKSAMALHLAISCAQRGYPVALFSAEMDRLEISHRAASHIAKVDSYAHQNGTMDRAERLRYQAAVSRLSELPLFIDDRTGSTVPAITAAIYKMKPQPRLIVIDYLQLLDAVSRPDTRAAAVAEVSRGLKRLATRLDVPVLALSQFNRDAARAGRRPELFDLRESGSIEQDASAAILLHAKRGEEAKPFMEVAVVVAKNRGGRKGEVLMRFEKPFCRFVEVES